MPLSLRPGKPLEFCLECDECDPPETRATFLADAKTIEQAYEIEETLMDTPETMKGVYNQRAELLASLLTGWRNMGDREYRQGSADQLKELLTHQEVIELIRKIQSGNTTSPEEKKS